MGPLRLPWKKSLACPVLRSGPMEKLKSTLSFALILVAFGLSSCATEPMTTTTTTTSTTTQSPMNRNNANGLASYMH